MDYEEKIPEFALVPAKAPNQYEFVQVEKIEEKQEEKEEKAAVSQQVSVKGIYDQLKVSQFRSCQCKEIYLEEDILVPDVKPDLKEILLMDGKPSNVSCRVETLGERKIKINGRGEVCLQVVYLPEGDRDGTSLVSMNSKMVIDKTWEQETEEKITGGTLKLSIERIEYMVINERKFRVKITLKGQLCQETTEDFMAFEGMQDEDIQLKKDTVQITDVAMKKQDTLEIDEVISYKESGSTPYEILTQNITIIPGYKQITGEKIVLNGFAACDMLLITLDEEGEQHLEQVQGKVEFTQFIPIESKGNWSGSNISFDDSQLQVEIINSEEDMPEIRMRGNMVATAELYKNTEKEIVIDGYHMKDNLCFEKQRVGYNVLIGNGVSEVSCREIVNLQEIGKTASRVVFAQARAKGLCAKACQGRVEVQGKILSSILCQDEEGGCHVIKLESQVKTIVDMPGAKEGDQVTAGIVTKDVWAEKINNSQIEFNCCGVVTVQVMEKREIHIIKDPALTKGEEEDKGAMIVYVARKNDKLWDIAKKYKTTVETLSLLNDLDNEAIPENKKILIVK